MKEWITVLRAADMLPINFLKSGRNLCFRNAHWWSSINPIFPNFSAFFLGVIVSSATSAISNTPRPSEKLDQLGGWYVPQKCKFKGAGPAAGHFRLKRWIRRIDDDSKWLLVNAVRFFSECCQRRCFTMPQKSPMPYGAIYGSEKLVKCETSFGSANACRGQLNSF
jgi:hypothetical protein